MEMQGVKSKTQLSEEIWKRIRSILNKREISQVELQKLCKECGYKVTQPEISKLYSGKLQLTLYQLTAFSEALNVPIDFLVNERDNFNRFRVTGQSFITNPADEAFSGYIGTYNTVFRSTSPFENKDLMGKISFLPSEKGDICEAEFELDTGETDLKGRKIIKKYQGQLIISYKMGVAYCILVNELIGEISVIAFRHRTFLVKQAECRLGLVLTVSAGEAKKPVVHRMFFARSELKENVMEKIIPFLKLESEEVLVREKDMLEFADKGNRTGYDFLSLLNHGEEEKYILIDEKSIRKQDKKLSRSDLAELYSYIKRYSAGTFLTALEEFDDNRTYEILRNNSEYNQNKFKMKSE